MNEDRFSARIGLLLPYARLEYLPQTDQEHLYPCLYLIKNFNSKEVKKSIHASKGSTL